MGEKEREGRQKKGEENRYRRDIYKEISKKVPIKKIIYNGRRKRDTD